MIAGTLPLDSTSGRLGASSECLEIGREKLGETETDRNSPSGDRPGALQEWPVPGSINLPTDSVPGLMSAPNHTEVSMFQKSTQWFVDRLVERMLPTVGTFLASALQRMLILGHADHHSQLEDQARRYESAGKPHLAELIRRESAQLNLDEPLATAPDVFENLAARNPEVPDSAPTLPTATPEPVKSKRKSRRRITSFDADDSSAKGAVE